MLFLLLIIPYIVAATPSCLVPSNSTTCPSGCRLLSSLPDAEIVAEFTCSDGSIHRCDAPYALVATSVQRALLEPMWTPPDLNGSFRTNSLGDGWYTECAMTDFRGERLLDSEIQTEGCTEMYACVCPVPDEEIPTIPELKVRTMNTSYTLGTGVGYRNSTFTVYASGSYVVSSSTRREVTSLASLDAVHAEAVEWALRSTNSSLIQVTDGAVEHEVGALFQWNGTLTIPHRSIWEFVVPYNTTATFEVGEAENVTTQAWWARWMDAGVVVRAHTPSFFVRDVLSRIS